jgi:hypothetical protein
MKRCLHTALALVVVSGLAFGQYLKEAFKIAHVSGAVRWSQCSFGPDGILHLIWEEDTDRGHPVFYSKYDGTTASFKYSDLSKKRAFAISTVGIAGIETGMVYFQ